MSELVITKPEGMDDSRWNATKAWLQGWLEAQSVFGDPWKWAVCPHNLFQFACNDCWEE